jgi:hypothetical protein
LLLAASPAAAQQSIEFGSITGLVLDQTGAPLADADVSAHHLATDVIVSARSDGGGRFRLSSLRVGAYELLVRYAGFRDASRTLQVNAGAAFDVTVSLLVSGIDTQLTVTAAETAIDTARTQIAATVSTPEIRALPLNGRNFLELALLAPGISAANVNSSQLFAETSAVPGISLSVNSQRNLSNNFIVDGLSANDDAAGLSGMAFSVDAIEQLQVVTSGGQAELGRALGGYVNVVTRSGTNRLQGEGYYYGRDDRLNARHPLSGIRLPMRQHQYGGSIGGPLVASHTFFFGNVEQKRLDQAGLVTIAPEAVRVINAVLDARGYPGPRVTTGPYLSPMDSTNVLAKVTRAASGRDQFAVRYSMYAVTSANARGAGALNAPSASSNLDNRDQAIAVTNTLTIGSRTVLESRGQVSHGALEALPSDPVGPAVTIAGVASFGTLSNSPTGRVGTLIQVVHSLSYQAGAHALRAGVDVLHNRTRITFPRARRGSYAFASLSEFAIGRYNTAGFTQTFGADELTQTNPNVGLYAQDEWHVRPGLTLNLGVRYDLQFLDSIETDIDNVAPRAGVAWAGESQRLVLRGSAGLFFDRVPLRAVANALLSAGNTTDLTRLRQVNVTLSPNQAAAPVFPDVLGTAVPSVTLPNLTTIDRHLRNAYSQQLAIEVEQRLGSDATLSAGYQYVRGRGLLMSINQNVPACLATGTNNGCRPFAGYANNSQYTAAGSSTYDGVQVSWRQQPTSWGNYRVSYTLSKAMNDVGEFFFSSPIDAFDLSKDWARSDGDQRHRLVVNGALRTPADRGGWRRIVQGLELSGMLQACSALPFNITSGVTTVQGSAARPLVNGAFIPRNAGEGSPYFAVNLRLARSFRAGERRTIEVLAEGFNITNHRNALTRNGNFGTGSYPDQPLPAFGRVTAVSEPRSLQLGVRVRF